MGDLKPCPFCKGEMMFRKALWPSDGNVDSIIHAHPTECGFIGYSDGTIDESIIGKWNDALRPPPDADWVEVVARAIYDACQPYVALGPDSPVPQWSSLQTGIWNSIAQAAISVLTPMLAKALEQAAKLARQRFELARELEPQAAWAVFDALDDAIRSLQSPSHKEQPPCP